MVRPSLKHALNALRWLMVGAPLALPIGMPLAANPFDASFTSFFRPATSTSLKMTKCGLSRLLSMACEVGTASISASDVREGISTRSDSSAARLPIVSAFRRVDEDELGALCLKGLEGRLQELGRGLR